MEITAVTKENVEALAPLTAEFRVELLSYKGIRSKPNVKAGRQELEEYLEAGFPIFAACCRGQYAGYVVCRVEGGVVWVESIYVKKEFRRMGIASMLHEKAEEIAAEYGEGTTYNYVHPNNHNMIAFLRKKGYTVLNLIEIRKPYPEEKLTQVIKVGEHEFDY